MQRRVTEWNPPSSITLMDQIPREILTFTNVLFSKETDAGLVPDVKGSRAFVQRQ